MKFLRPTRTPRFNLAMMGLGELFVALEVNYQPVIGLGLPDSEPGEEWNQKQHRHDRYVVRGRRNLPKLVPVLDGINKESQQDDNDTQADYFVSARIGYSGLFDYRAHLFFSTFISDSSITGAGPEIPPSLRIRQKCTAMNIDATRGMPMQCQI